MDHMHAWLDISKPIGSKAEGAKTDTPPKTNTYKRLPIVDIALLRTIPNGAWVFEPMEWRF